MSVSKVYNEKYAGGYGLQYPDGHIIRIYNYLERKYKLSERENKTMLDFGCGTGIHSIFFEEKGFDAYGVDVSDIAIEKYNERLNHYIEKKQKNNMGGVEQFEVFVLITPFLFMKCWIRNLM